MSAPVTQAGKEELLDKLVGAEGEEEDKEMKHLRSQIKLNEVVSGIKFTTVDWEVKRKGVSHWEILCVELRGYVCIALPV